ncbi:ACS family tartrate transporter-like MFS transporter [Paraburkholderia sp. BL6665CI2N2]|uniref:MFS transporter n=1 Tax=Paraburkholderia sp. BL6665CI2N2 TaxID=1938806 RepID=UPI001066F0A3|nr:MFS transporter [Paraburkholderia sp. BL6665CI2N2]TDY15828.1 ACS family tartrate transporter-like MFS transporter [Paraburkholderia sp. BL6665CI2N2]
MVAPSHSPSLERKPDRAAPTSVAEDKSYVIRKVGRRMMWYLFALYLISILDRGNLGFAAFSMNRDLGLTSQMFSVGVGVLFLGYAIFELPSNLMLARFGARVTLTRIALLFGVVTMSMAFVKGPMGFYVVRAALGVAEAGLSPGVFLFLSFWIPSAYRARYNAMFSYAVPCAYVLASLISGAILQLDGVLNVPGWKWLFLLEGLPAVALGIFGIFYLTNRPKDAHWLAEHERKWLQEEVDADVRLEVKHDIGTARQLLKSPAMFLLSLAFIGIFCGAASLAVWLPQIMHANGVPLRYIGLISAVPPLAGMVGMTFLCRHSDRKRERIYHASACMLLAAVGYGIVAISHEVFASLGGFMLANIGVYSSYAIFWAIPQTYFPAKVKPAAIALISSVGALFGGWIGPMVIGHVQDRMHDLAPGLVVVVVVFVISACCVLLAGRVLRRSTATV